MSDQSSAVPTPDPSTTPPTTAPTPPTPKPVTGDPMLNAFGADVVRFIVPTAVGIAVSVGAKAGFHITAADAYAKIAPAVSVGCFGIVRFIETKWPAAGRLLGTKNPL